MKKIEVRFANPKDDFLKIAECLYHTDPFIYPAAYGENISLAAAAMAETIKLPNSLLSFRKMVVALCDNEVCGVLLYSDCARDWDSAFYYDLAKYYIPNKTAFEYVAANYFEKEAVSPPQNHIHIIAVCVSPEYRRKGIARRLLEFFTHNKSAYSFDLDVLAENTPAIHLYEQFGFKKTHLFKGFSLSEELRPNCYHMIFKKN